MIMFFVLHWWWVHWRSSYYQHFNSCYQKDSLQIRALVSSGILLEMWKQAPDCLNQNLHFNKLPVIVCILKFKNHHSKIYVYLISILLYKKNQLITAYSQYSYMGLEKGMATHSNILAWRIQMDRGAWRATVHGVTKSDTERLSN